MSSPPQRIEEIEDTLDAHFSRNAPRGTPIYTAVLTLLGVAAAALPIVRVGVFVEARGIVRTLADRHEVVAATSGFIDQVLAGDDAHVEAGTPLVTMVGTALEGRRVSLAALIEEVEAGLGDLNIILQWRESEAVLGLLSTERYAAEYDLYRKHMSEVGLRLKGAERELDRAIQQDSIGVTSRWEQEDLRIAIDQLLAERAALEARYSSEWQAERSALAQERVALAERQATLEADATTLSVVAPISGTVERPIGLSRGSFVSAGQPIASITPNDELVAEVMVPATDFGLLEVGKPARILIDSYNYLDWGFVSGTVRQIVPVIVPGELTPMFRTVVELDSDHLSRPNGVRRELGVGMTLRARFMVAERSLWQLLRDDFDQWLNPQIEPA